MDEDIIVTLKRSNDLLMTFGNDYSDVFLPAIDEIERLRNAIKVQANAVRVLHEAEMSELNRLRKNAQEAYTAKATLDSEREANKILTDEIERSREALREIYEVYAGSEGIPQPMTAAEGYLLFLLKETAKIAQETLQEKK